MAYYANNPIKQIGDLTIGGPGWYYNNDWGPYPTEEEAIIAELKWKHRTAEEKHENFINKLGLIAMFAVILVSGGGCSLIGLGM